MIRVRAGISYALTEAMDEGHCGLSAEELTAFGHRVARGPRGVDPDRARSGTGRENGHRRYGRLKFIEAAHVKDLLAILRWAENPRDALAGFRVLQLLPGIGPASAKKAMTHLGEHRFDLGELAGFAPPDAAALSWPGFCRMLRRLRDAATAWAGQVGLVRTWYQPHLERLYDSRPRARGSGGAGTLHERPACCRSPRPWR